MEELGSVDRFWATRALEFATSLAAVSSCEDVMDLFRREIAQVGFHSHIMVTVDERDFTRRVMASGWHPQWTKIYTQERALREADPVRQKLLRTTNAFLWSEVRYDPQ